MLKIVGNKLAPLVIKQYSFIVGVKKDIQELKELADEINIWLEDKEGHRAMGGAKSLNWLKTLKDIAYTVDDIVDDFQLETEKLETNGYGGIMSKHLCKKTKSFLLQCKVAHKIKAVKKRFSVIVKQRTDLTAIVGHNPVSLLNKTTMDMPTLPIVNEAAVLGRCEDKNKIITKLVKAYDQQELEVVSIIGLGGTGKTTLAKLVFHDCEIIKKHFEIRLWVHVSQEFNMEKLVEKLFEAVTKDKSDHYSLQYMSETISKELTGKNFLLVLDDVWIEDRSQHVQFQEKFMVHLKSSTSRSKILVTTRSRRVAEVMESAELHDLPFLSLDDSWKLFNRSFGPGLKELGYEYQQVGKEIVGKCGGVPLAIKVLAGTLRDKKLIGEWEAMRDNNLLDVEGEESVSACLKLSYFYLPPHLKQCFTFCSLFPKGHGIYKEQLIDLWIAHNMICLTDGIDYLEDIGEKHFSSLVQCSFLHDVDEHYGRLRCNMHDLVHDLARSILSEEISTSVPEDATNYTKGYRYFCLTNIQGPRKLLPKKVFSNARAMYVHKDDGIICGKTLKKAKLLRSVIADHITSTVVLTAIFQVKNLKYLEMTRLQCEALPEAISDIWSLQAVHLTYSLLIKLPKSIGKLQKLRTLNVSGCGKLKCLPDSIGDCNMLSSIDLCNCKVLTDLPNSIGRNEKLRVLRIGCTKIEKLPSSITTLKNLECLDLCSCRELVELPEGIGNLQKLQVLNLEDCVGLVELPKGIGNLEKLQVLNLKRCKKLGGVPIGIGQLSRLQKLGVFVVGEGEKFAGISELANIGGNINDLNIIGIERLMEPHNAHKACLKQKTNLQRLRLEWKRYYDVGEVNTERQQGVLDGLEPPPGIKELEIYGYSGSRYAQWMQNKVGGGGQGIAHFSFLRVMNLSTFPNLKELCGLVELPCLEELVLHKMPSLESISGGPFPSLVTLIMQHLPCLGDVWMVAERTMSDGEEGGSCSNCTPHLGQEFRVGNCLLYLTVTDCPKLKVKPYLPLSLQQLDLNRVSEPLLESPGPGRCEGYPSLFSCSHLKTLNLVQITAFGSWNLLQHMTALESLKIDNLYELTELPESLRSLHSLQKLTIDSCSMMTLPQSMGHLTSLHSLDIYNCSAIHKLPECLGKLCSLQQLNIKSCNSLSSLPQSMGHLSSLRTPHVEDLPNIKSLPQSL
ncbi:hypothetical protein BS78_K338600 [Paspalum vaginatum]|uniref:Uncharacterized protein n=1 Tax=Paspalum vaginatum TaxID=158149 RepID=A0A9W7XCZ2_9POAL|nr:hypothetical protein BS78_K338600 [Paspalum vaginatum]